MQRLVQAQHELIRAQQIDPNHQRLAKEVVARWARVIGGQSVLDVGCGRAIARRVWEQHGYQWTGVTMGPDYEWLRHEFGEDFPVVEMDMHDVDGEYDVVYARHILEHSPLPALALARWMGLAPWLIVVVPAFQPCSFEAVGHISIFPESIWRRYFRFLNLRVIRFEEAQYNNPLPWPQQGSEYRFLLRRPK